LTDLAQPKLTTFYGEEDDAALQNVLHNVPNIVPQQLSFADTSPNDNNNVVDSGSVTLMPDCGLVQSRHSGLHTIDESDLHDSSSQSTATVHTATVHTTVHPDKDGAYVNPVVTENTSPDHVGDVSHSESTVSRKGKRLVRQDSTDTEEDLGMPVETSADGGLDHGKGSHTEFPQNTQSSLSPPDDPVKNSTLHTFLKMVSTQSLDVNTEQSESRGSPSEGRPPAEVIFYFFL